LLFRADRERFPSNDHRSTILPRLDSSSLTPRSEGNLCSLYSPSLSRPTSPSVLRFTSDTVRSLLLCFDFTSLTLPLFSSSRKQSPRSTSTRFKMKEEPLGGLRSLEAGPDSWTFGTWSRVRSSLLSTRNKRSSSTKLSLSSTACLLLLPSLEDLKLKILRGKTVRSRTFGGVDFVPLPSLTSFFFSLFHLSLELESHRFRFRASPSHRQGREGRFRNQKSRSVASFSLSSSTSSVRVASLLLSET